MRPTDYLEVDLGFDLYGDDEVRMSVEVHLREGGSVFIFGVVGNPVRHGGCWVFPRSPEVLGEVTSYVPAADVTHFTAHVKVVDLPRGDSWAAAEQHDSREDDGSPREDRGTGWRLLFDDDSVMDLDEDLLAHLTAIGAGVVPSHDSGEELVRLGDPVDDGDDWPSLCQLECPDSVAEEEVWLVARGLAVALRAAVADFR